MKKSVLGWSCLIVGVICFIIAYLLSQITNQEAIRISVILGGFVGLIGIGIFFPWDSIVAKRRK